MGPAWTTVTYNAVSEIVMKTKIANNLAQPTARLGQRDAAAELLRAAAAHANAHSVFFVELMVAMDLHEMAVDEGEIVTEAQRALRCSANLFAEPGTMNSALLAAVAWDPIRMETL